MKILIADDEATTLKLLEKVLSKWGYEVQGARDGNEAWDIINSEDTPPLLLLDWMMPGYDGIELCKMTQKNRKNFIYIMLMTANENRGSLQTALDAGAHIFIPKPVSLPELKSHVSVGQRLVHYDEQLRDQNQKLEELAEQRAQELIHADRLATLGTLTAGIAHEINNPSSFISGNAQTLEKFWTVIDPLLEKNSEAAENKEQVKFIREEVPKVIHGIKEGVRRISTITQGLKNYSRKDRGDIEDVDISHVISEALLICNNKLKTQVIVECQLDEKLPLVKSNAQQLEQVFINLITNAADAMEAHNGGKLKISATHRGANVLVLIKDNGPGIPEKLLQKIFDPFFTTKEVGKGTGLGLSICQRILNDLGGLLSVENLTTGGAQFTIKHPLKGAENVH